MLKLFCKPFIFSKHKFSINYSYMVVKVVQYCSVAILLRDLLWRNSVALNIKFLNKTISPRKARLATLYCIPAYQHTSIQAYQYISKLAHQNIILTALLYLCISQKPLSQFYILTFCAKMCLLHPYLITYFTFGFVADLQTSLCHSYPFRLIFPIAGLRSIKTYFTNIMRALPCIGRSKILWTHRDNNK